MKKIYVYVGQLRGWMLRVAKRVKGLLGKRVMNEATHSIGSSSDPLPLRGLPLKEGRVQGTDSLNAHPSALNSPNETLLVRAERTTFGMYVRRMGFEQVRRENKRYFAAKLQ